MTALQKLSRALLGILIVGLFAILIPFIGLGSQTIQAAAPHDCIWQWRQVHLPPSAPVGGTSFLNDLAITDQETWAAGYFARKYEHPLLMRHTDTGWQVEKKRAIRGWVSGIDAVESNDIWAVGTRWQPALYETPLVLHYDGAQWLPITDAALNFTGELHDVRAIAHDNVWAVGYQIIPDMNGPSSLIVHWDGTVWQVVPSPNQQWWYYSLSGIATVNANDIWVVGMKTDWDSQLAAFFHWDGNLWSEFPTPLGGGLNDVSARAADDVWAVGGAGTVVHWDGTSWNSVEFPFRADLQSVIARETNDVWVAGSTVKNGFSAGLLAHWDGTKWTREFIGSQRTFYQAIADVSNTRLLAVGNAAFQSAMLKGRCK